MSKWLLEDTNRGTTRECDSKTEAEDAKQDLIGLGANADDLEITPPGKTDGGETETHSVEMADDAKPTNDTVEADVINSPEALSRDPIQWLESHNADFVNTIKGTPAISKMGFRFIQSQFGITTESEVVQWVDDPTGCIVWARAELPDGQAAEAHGEGYLSESRVDDNEFVRYADTRAKNRAISDLTSAGALAVSEVGDTNE